MSTPLVTGLGVVCAAGLGVDELWAACASGKTNTRRIDHFDPGSGACDRAGIVPLDGAAPPPGTPSRLRHLARLAIEEALADSGVPVDGTGLVLATTDSEAVESVNAWNRWRTEQMITDAASLTDLAEDVGFTGPVLSVGNASAAGAAALCLGADLISADRAERVVVCGVDTVTETAFYGLSALRTLSGKGCRPFQAGRSGMMVSEGAAAVVLQAAVPVGARLQRPYATLAGTGMSNHGRQAARPDSEGIARAIRAALHSAGMTAGDLDYVNAHAAGTRQGDRAELNALAEVLGDRLRAVPVVSSKAALGHCQGAAGVVEALVGILTVHRGEVLPTLLRGEVDEEWADLHFGPVPGMAPPRSAMSLSCGLGSANAALIFRAYHD